jgi:hypothetical protein
MEASAPRRPKRSPGLSDRAANIITAVVTVVWVANVVGGMFEINGYQPSEGINTIFTVIVGGAFVLRYKTRDE